MGFRIRAVIDGHTVWFQGILLSSVDDVTVIDFAWTTIAAEACTFGLKAAADDTLSAIGTGEVVTS